MEYAVLGWPEDEPQLRLDYREFSYAGKFVMSNTGKAVAREVTEGNDDELVAAVAFNEDRTDPATAWLRYVTVRKSRRGEGVGAELTRFTADQLLSRGYDRVKIAVNNPFAYHALYKAGFGYTGDQTGIAELVLAQSADTEEGSRSRERYQSGLDVYRKRDLSAEERNFLVAKDGERPPEIVASP
ncbi:GNAT family N-acetyltransferase [Halorussus halophilus]|uniref:GNAT family N-acetyltransferase n=1 Tax=Halorussus halophilus TaxID=2650975 RepID=UPI00130169FC|nr:GNAT family N-acetyltransferase [Halorussus halophilus]